MLNETLSATIRELEATIRNLESEQRKTQKALDVLYPLVGLSVVSKVDRQRQSGFRKSSMASIVREFLKTHPGLTVPQITDGLEGKVTAKNVQSTMGSGQKTGWVKVDRTTNPYSYYYVEVTPQKQQTKGYQTGETVSRIKNYLENNGGKSIADIAQFLEMSKNQVGNTLYGRHAPKFVCDRTTSPITWSLTQDVSESQSQLVVAGVPSDEPSIAGLNAAFEERYGRNGSEDSQR